jgi:hypothetical protein
MRFTAAAPTSRSFGVSEGDVSAEANHAEAGGDALASTEARVVLEFALERRSEQNDEEIGHGVEDYGDRAENDELEEHVAGLGRDELRDEG